MEIEHLEIARLVSGPEFDPRTSEPTLKKKKPGMVPYAYKPGVEEAETDRQTPGAPGLASVNYSTRSSGW